MNITSLQQYGKSLRAVNFILLIHRIKRRPAKEPLQLLYEYQTMMASLTGMDVSNASMYDGATALAEAALMAVRSHKTSRRILIPQTVHPIYRQVVRAIVSNKKLKWSNCHFAPIVGKFYQEEIPRKFSTRGIRRIGHSTTQLLWCVGTSRRIDRLGAQQKCSCHRCRQSNRTRLTDSTGRMG